MEDPAKNLTISHYIDCNLLEIVFTEYSKDTIKKGLKKVSIDDESFIFMALFFKEDYVLDYESTSTRALSKASSDAIYKTLQESEVLFNNLQEKNTIFLFGKVIIFWKSEKKFICNNCGLERSFLSNTRCRICEDCNECCECGLGHEYPQK